MMIVSGNKRSQRGTESLALSPSHSMNMMMLVLSPAEQWPNTERGTSYYVVRTNCHVQASPPKSIREAEQGIVQGAKEGSRLSAWYELHREQSSWALSSENRGDMDMGTADGELTSYEALILVA